MIELNNISKVFHKGEANEVTALKDLSLTIPKGQFLVIIGSNGSGKTTLLNLISGVVMPGTGSIYLSEKDVTHLPEYKRSKWITRVFQNPLSGTAPDLSIIDNFRLAALRTSTRKAIIGVNEAFKKQVRDKIATLGMGLENKIEQPMGTLSGGQRQALTLLMSVMDNTEILLLDEPTAALDPRSANLILQIADNLVKQYHLTTVFITHNLKDAHQYGDRLIQMGEGKILRDLDAKAKAALKPQDIFEWFD
jgi:putative ABC transport system ATP-binding protein